MPSSDGPRADEGKGGFPINTHRPLPTLSSLTHEWNTARNTNKGWPLFLDSVQIDGLRGWTGEVVEFRFPVVAIAGENGAGKSTILKAAAAAYTAEQTSGYTFYPDDFFPNTPWEKVEGVTLTYQVRRGTKIDTQTLRKRTSRWRGMPDRFSRPIFFLDISRTQPVNTQIGYGKAATQANFTAAVTPFDETDRALLSRIMNRPYTSSGMATFQNKQVGVLDAGAGEYSNFHQGAGEDATADLVDLLRSAPDRSLIIIDEVEASLHPRAQRRLMAELFAIAEKRKMQFILSTHSSTIMEQLPTEARIHIQTHRGGGRNVLYGVTARFAMSLMDDVDHPELVLFCEDDKAAVLIDALINQEAPGLSRRVEIIAAGAASTVTILGELASKGRLPSVSLGVLDADQAEQNGCLTLPGTQAPEKELFDSLDDTSWEKVAMRLDVRAGELLQAVDDARQIDNHHAWTRRVAEHLGPRVRTDRVWEAIAAVWAKDSVAPAERAAFVRAVEQKLVPAT
ncbi:AAA family ATPase [Streptomyces sp. KAI 90]|uniref:ATP-dependent nuclease n=1 Tax=Streptomyces sp. KAI 90 TaxID=1076400 RepID=UPI001587CEBA|nr:AAA family ATPase [Streptomyces sp. KAI 90]NUV91607.1 AAA family ATPase [Streptomyces sp. KAI 90]